MYTIGIHIGGTNTRVVLIKENQILEKHVFSTNVDDTHENTNNILRIIELLSKKSKIEGK